MKKHVYFVFILLIYFSCNKKVDENKFNINLTHYNHSVEIILPKSYDTLNIWNNYSDNQMDDKKMYRVQNSKLKILKESGFFFKTDIKDFEQFTIVEPLLTSNKLPELNVSRWLKEKKQQINEEKSRAKVEIDSIVVNRKKIALIKIVYDFDKATHKLLKCAIDINGERLDMNFFTSLSNSDNFFEDAISSLKTIKVKPLK